MNKSSVKTVAFKYFQPATLLVIVLFWTLAPTGWAKSAWTIFAVGIVLKMVILGLEWVNERHAGWRLTKVELLTDLFYVGLGYTVIRYTRKHWGDAPVEAAKHAFGIHTPWLEHAPFLLQVGMIASIGSISGYWMHRAMHNWTPLWLTHAPHHYVTQLNALKGAVGNPIELFLIGLGIDGLFDFSLPALFCAGTMMGAVSTFAHANVRFDPPRWYSFFFTTVEHHSLHHSVDYASTRCNYADSLILIDRIFGTFRTGESAVVGQENGRRLSIGEQFIYPFVPLIAMIKARRGVAIIN